MIRSHKNSITEAVAHGKAPKGFPSDILKSAQMTRIVWKTCSPRRAIAWKR